MPVFDLNTPTQLLFHWGWLLVTVANAVAFIGLLVVFALGALVRLPRTRKDVDRVEAEVVAAGGVLPTPEPALGAVDVDLEPGNWMGAARRYVSKYWPYDRVLPSDEPVYVTKLFYMFGSLAMMTFVLLIVTGCVLVFKGSLWWHTSSAGLFVNSLHFWSVQVFFFCIFVHFGSSFFTAAWRGGRGFTWVFGACTMFVSVLSGFTGYVTQGGFDGQFIAQQGKDPLNASGLGYFLNLLNLDIVTGWHFVLLPLAAAAFLGLHLLWIRRHGVVPPFPPDGVDFEGAPEPEGPRASEVSSSTRGQDA